MVGVRGRTQRVPGRPRILFPAGSGAALPRPSRRETRFLEGAAPLQTTRRVKYQRTDKSYPSASRVAAHWKAVYNWQTQHCTSL
jgi:hypothetical protein